jgi:holliday junction DNA helicase RuvA
MIARLRGTVLERQVSGASSQVVVDVGGVGYEVVVTPRLFAELEPGAPADLHVHHHFREDDQTLYGFAQRDERSTFRVLLGAHGVGPALALAIVATHRPAVLADIVATSDLASLTMVPGVGKKTAERLLIELRSRLSMPVLDPDTTTGSAGSVVIEVREALSGLGYGPDEVREALSGLSTDGVDAATLLRQALGVLGARRA